MTYLKSLFFNFLVVFFANHILPGIEVVNQTKLPNFGGDFPFALALGFLNSLIYPVLKLLNQLTMLRIAMVALILNFAVYALLKLFSFVGIQIQTVEGYIFASAAVALGSFITNFLEFKRHHPHKAHIEPLHKSHTEHPHS